MTPHRELNVSMHVPRESALSTLAPPTQIHQPPAFGGSAPSPQRNACTSWKAARTTRRFSRIREVALIVCSMVLTACQMEYPRPVGGLPTPLPSVAPESSQWRTLLLPHPTGTPALIPTVGIHAPSPTPRIAPVPLTPRITPIATDFSGLTTVPRAETSHPGTQRAPSPVITREETAAGLARRTVVVMNTGEAGVRLRSFPVYGETVAVWPDGTMLAVVFPSTVSPSTARASWVGVRGPDGQVGWVAAEFLSPPTTDP